MIVHHCKITRFASTSFRLQNRIPSRFRRSQLRRFTVRGQASKSTQTTLVEVPPPSTSVVKTPFQSIPVWTLIGVQSLALIGACVGGLLARKRRHELELLTQKLRRVNFELRKQREMDLHVCEADGDAEAMRSYRAALEVALDAPSAAHPIEAYGPGEQSIAGARREFSRSIQDSRECLRKGEKSEAQYLCKNALFLAKEMQDIRAERSASKLQAQIFRSSGESVKALSTLKTCLGLSDRLNDHSGDVDVLGDIGDIYADLGDYERAGKVTTNPFISPIAKSCCVVFSFTICVVK
eukprot:g9206.t1